MSHCNFFDISFSEFLIRGVHPVGGNIDNAIPCNCGPATGKVRKEIELHVAWNDDVGKPGTDSFNAVKQNIESQVNTGSQT